MSLITYFGYSWMTEYLLGSRIVPICIDQCTKSLPNHWFVIRRFRCYLKVIQIIVFVSELYLNHTFRQRNTFDLWILESFEELGIFKDMLEPSFLSRLSTNSVFHRSIGWTIFLLGFTLKLKGGFLKVFIDVMIPDGLKESISNHCKHEINS